MSDLNLDPNYFNHRKTKRLIGLLGRSSEVLPIRLWAYYAQAYPKGDGRLTGHAAQEIESLAGWWGASGAMVAAMMTDKAGFIDQDEDGTYRLHNWTKRQGHICRLKEHAEMMAEKRWAKHRAEQAAMLTASPTAMHHPPIHPPTPPTRGGDQKRAKILAEIAERRRK